MTRPQDGSLVRSNTKLTFEKFFGSTIIYLNNAIDMKTHDEFWDIAHQIVKPVVDACQNVDWFIVVPESRHGEFRVKHHTEQEQYVGFSGGCCIEGDIFGSPHAVGKTKIKKY